MSDVNGRQMITKTSVLGRLVNIHLAVNVKIFSSLIQTLRIFYHAFRDNCVSHTKLHVFANLSCKVELPDIDDLKTQK